MRKYAPWQRFIDLPLPVLVTFALGMLFLYWRVLPSPFISLDDQLLITKNPIVQHVNLHTLWLAFTSYDPELYIPLTFVSYQLNIALTGLSSFAMHFTNLLLHIANSLLVFAFVDLLTRRRFVAIACLLLFAFHPIHTEAVAWASGRKDVLAGFFALLSLVSYLEYRETDERKWYRRSIAAFLCALLSKASVLFLPFALVLIDYYRGVVDRKMLREKIPFFALSIAFGIIALFGKTETNSTLSEKILISGRSILFAIEKILVPINFSLFYHYDKAIDWSNAELVISLAIVLAVISVIFFLRKKFPVLAFGSGFFLIFLGPSLLNFAKGIGGDRFVYLFSDRYAYLASIGIILIIAYILDVLRERSRSAAVSVLTILTLLLLTLTAYQTTVWKDTTSVFSHVLELYPNSPLAMNAIAGDLYLNGDRDAALRLYRQSIAVRPSSAVYFNIGQILLEEQSLVPAEEAFRQAVKIRPTDRDTEIQFGVTLRTEGKYAEALQTFEYAQTLDPQFGLITLNIGLVKEALGDRVGAIDAYRNALKLDPNLNLANQRLRALGQN